MRLEVGDIINPEPNFYYLVEGIDESKDYVYLFYLNHDDKDWRGPHTLCYSLDSLKKGWTNWIYKWNE